MKREWMSPERKWMSPAVRDELITAIKERQIGNATAFADEFAERHDLNAQTVRSAISRYRRRLGLLEQPHGPQDPDAVFLAQIGRLCEMNANELAAVRARMVRQQEWIEKAINLVDALGKVAA